MTNLKDLVYDAVILDILHGIFEIEPTSEQRKEISEIIDDILDPEEIESQEVN